MSLEPALTARKGGLPRPLLYALAALGLIAAILVGWQLLKPKAPKEPYRTEAVQQGDITRSVSASGSLQALITVDVGSQISGQIKDVRVDFNDHVRQGQVLAVLDPQTYQSRVRQGEAEVTVHQATFAQQQAQAEVARAGYNRSLTLFNQGIVAKAGLETAEAQWKAAEANVRAARAGITQARAALDTAQIDLRRTTIIAPIDGVVVNRAIEPGQTVAASLQAPVLFQIAQDLSRLEVKITVDEADIGQVRQGQAVRFTVDAFPDDTYTGVVTQVRQQPETEANVVAYIVIAQADNPGGKLMPGMTANADIVIEQRRAVLKVPVAALRWTPADQQAQTQRTTASSTPGGGRSSGATGQGNGMLGARLLEELDLDAGQKTRAEAILAEARGKAQAAGSSDPQARRQATRQATQEALTRLEPILKPAQREKLVALRARLAAMGGARTGGMTPGVVYVLREGKPVAVAVRVGASDGSFSQIVGSLKAGDAVIIGGGPKPKPKPSQGGPMGATPVRVRM